MKNHLLKKGKVFSLLFFSQLIAGGLTAQSVTFKYRSSVPLVDYTVEVPVKDLKLTIGNYVASVDNKEVPVEIVEDIRGEQIAVFPVERIGAGQKMKISLQNGTAEAYPKRTYAELSHKIGGEFEGHKYEGGYSWVKPNYIALPGNFRDHSYYIKYEGPGWENDRVVFRFYLDNRNAIDVYGKKTTDIVLPAVGIDGFENYHHMSFWGMDNMKVGNGLGIGTIAIWDGEKAVRVEKKDSIISLIPADGKVRSQVKTTYLGWEANGKKCNMTSLITIDAGSRASRMELLIDRQIDNIATGIIKDKNSDLITDSGTSGEWSYIATFGKQSLNSDMQGLAVFFRRAQMKEIAEDNLNHVVVLQPSDGYVDYYFMPTWELDPDPVKDKDKFMQCIGEVLNRLNNPLSVKTK